MEYIDVSSSLVVDDRPRQKAPFGVRVEGWKARARQIFRNVEHHVHKVLTAMDRAAKRVMWALARAFMSPYGLFGSIALMISGFVMANVMMAIAGFYLALIWLLVTYYIYLARM